MGRDEGSLCPKDTQHARDGKGAFSRGNWEQAESLGYQIG